jgi:hypothetical protein
MPAISGRINTSQIILRSIIPYFRDIPELQNACFYFPIFRNVSATLLNDRLHRGKNSDFRLNWENPILQFPATEKPVQRR